MFKRLISLVLALTLVLIAAVPAFASDEINSYDSVSASEPSKNIAEDTIDKEVPDGATPVEITGSEGTPADENEEQPGEGEVTDDDKLTGDDKVTGETELTDDDKVTVEAPSELSAAEKKAIKYRNGLAAYIRSKNYNLSKSWSRTLADYFIKYGKKRNIDPLILMALAQRESNFRAKAASPYGYKGMMQTSDALARKYGYKPSSLYEAKVSIDVASRHLGSMKKSYKTYTKTLSAYVYGGYAVQHGNYSKKAAYQMLDTRRAIKSYLNEHNYI